MIELRRLMEKFSEWCLALFRSTLYLTLFRKTTNRRVEIRELLRERDLWRHYKRRLQTPLNSFYNPTMGSFSRGSGARWILVEFLRCQNDDQISALSWSPCGRYLASASYDSSSFTIWDVSQGTPIRRGLGGISMLKWSPTGDYFFAARFDGTFCLWETNTWIGAMVFVYWIWICHEGLNYDAYFSGKGALWDPEGRFIMISFSKSSTLGSVHFSSKPPSLDAHLLPVELPEIASLTSSEGINKIAWDSSGERLAVSFKRGDDNYKGLIAVYDTRSRPIVSASLVGFIRGPGENPKALSFSFHDKFKQGPLLSVCWSTGFCCTYPLSSSAHMFFLHNQMVHCKLQTLFASVYTLSLFVMVI